MMAAENDPTTVRNMLQFREGSFARIRGKPQRDQIGDKQYQSVAYPSFERLDSLLRQVGLELSRLGRLLELCVVLTYFGATCGARKFQSERSRAKQ